jgi:hypothetical protein
MKFAKKIVAAIAVTTAFAAPAFAGTLGMADLAITGLGIINAGNGAPVLSGINITSESRTGNASSVFNGVIGTGVDAFNNIVAFGSGAEVDVKNRCAGSGCGGAAMTAAYGTVENNFFTHITTPVANYALGDMFIGGSAITNDGAQGMTRADTSITGATNSGSANATIANSVTAVTAFTATSTMDAFFALGYNAFVKAFVNPSAGSTGQAFGTISWALTLVDSNTGEVSQWTPPQLNTGRASSNFGQNKEYSSAGSVVSQVIHLVSGHEYLLTINQASNSVAREIPEPGSMLLVAMGLFALGAASRRRSK